MKTYKIPLRSEIAFWVTRLLPNRVHAWIWINAYDELREHCRDVKITDDDGFTLTSVVDEIRIETLRRKMFRDYLHATTEER